jgi:hypothetical protein
MTERKGDWLQTYTGLAYWPLDPRADEVRIEDIAHALSQLCRYTGHCKRFYSVAEHSVHVSRLVPPEHALTGLLHDATEAYINDLNRPLKYQLPEYRRVEDTNWRVIAEKFGLPFVMPRAVKDVDGTMLWAERRELFHGDAPRAWGMGVPEPNPYPELGAIGLPPTTAKWHFLARYRELTKVAV